MLAHKQNRNILIGVLGVLTIVGVMAWQATNKLGQSSDAYTIIGEFNSAEGIALGNVVSLAGITVGQVSHVTYNPDNQTVLLSLSINTGVELPTDSSASIVSDGFFGGKYVKLSPGGMPDFLEDGDTLEYVQGSVNLKELLEKIVDNADKSTKGTQ